MHIKSLFTAAILPMAFTLSACSGGGAASTDAIGARQDVMKNWGDAMGVMGGMMKAPDTFDAAVFKEQAAYLATSADEPWQHFANENDVGDATPAVWSNADGFKAESEKFQQAAADLNTAAQNASSIEDVSAQFQAVGATCKSCHTEFKSGD